MVSLTSPTLVDDEYDDIELPSLPRLILSDTASKINEVLTDMDNSLEKLSEWKRQGSTSSPDVKNKTKPTTQNKYCTDDGDDDPGQNQNNKVNEIIQTKLAATLTEAKELLSELEMSLKPSSSQRSSTAEEEATTTTNRHRSTECDDAATAQWELDLQCEEIMREGLLEERRRRRRRRRRNVDLKNDDDDVVVVDGIQNDVAYYPDVTTFGMSYDATLNGIDDVLARIDRFEEECRLLS